MDSEILVIGAAIVDVLARPVGADVFETGSQPVDEICMSTGGDALNEATVLARMGKKVSLCTVLGDDMAGRIIAEHCRDEGIEVEEECIRKEITTGVNIVLVEKDGERNFLTNPHGSLRKLTASDIRLPFPDTIKILSFASIFVSPEMGTPEMETVFRAAKEQGITVCADMTKCKNGERAEDIAPALKYVDYLFANSEEAALLTGGKTPEECAALLAETGAGHVIVKCGAQGCFVCAGERCFHVPAEKTESCVDTTGAGDSFAAGFIWALSEGKPPDECAAYACHCGAQAVMSAGAVRWSEKMKL